ncbi:BQ5605_C010g05935 [Microbotryum silenes-dioicae]|uniref:cyclin-dependent kinase n=1 Tax=Microbotryum silenes-dioicae TaxID=796604 RepID=A0A2X0NSY7_9BASI|nr:BQ5605_C010g05935 [Microbotryum silenes-dioicae]
MEPDRQDASTSQVPLHAGAAGPPPRKKSKWDDDDPEEDARALQQAREKKRLKKLELEAKLAREKQRSSQQDGGKGGLSIAPLSVKGAAIAASGSGSVGNGKGADPTSRNGSEARTREATPAAAGGERPSLATVIKTRRPRGRAAHPPLQSCRSVYCYERLNEIEEGSYGIVFRARCKTTGDIVALKKLKMDKEKNGFPITSLREIQTLMTAAHEYIVRVREVVVGDTLTQVFIVMDFVEHDLKTLLATMSTPFLASEIKTLLLQLLSAIALCHDNWIIHRDLKTSNLLMNNRGQIKVADFGLARTYGDPLGDMTQLVVTLWYRAPELLFGATEYTTAVDMWSIGCIFGELILKEPLLPGKGEIDQVAKIFKLLGRPTEEIWPGFTKLPNAKNFNLAAAQPSVSPRRFLLLMSTETQLDDTIPLCRYSNLRQTFKYTTAHGLDLMSRLLAYDPEKRISTEEALRHPYFSESPLPKHSDLFASFPSVANGEKKQMFASPSAPSRAAE